MFVLSRVKKQQQEIILERYHGPLITDGVELGYIKIVPWMNLLASIFWYFAAYYNDIIGVIQCFFGGCVLISAFSIFFSFFNSVIEKYNIFTYLLLSLNFFILLVWLDFIGIMMFIGGGDVYLRVYSITSRVFIIFLFILFLVMIFIVYPYFYRRDRRTNGAYREKESKFNSEDNKLFSSNFLIIFGLVVFVPPLLTGYIENVFGLFSGILFTLTIPALVVDAFYAALYAKQHPEEIDEL